MENQFCQPKKIQKECIRILSEIVALDIDTLNSYYEEMKSDYVLPEKEFSEKIPVDKLTGIFRDFIGFSSLGIDIPIWYNLIENKNINKIMIIGQSPRRNSKDYAPNELREKLIIGSPFSLVNYNDRDGSNNYWKFISSLISENTGLYITDAYKLYFEIDLSVSNRQIDKQKFNETNKSLLQKEIDFVKPNVIITLGKEAKNAVINLLKLDEENINKTTLKQKIDEREIQFHFIPHISKMNLQKINTVAELFIAMGWLKEDMKIGQLDENKKLSNIGEEIREYKSKLF